MTISIKRVLKKKKWLGSDAGKLLFASLINDIKTQVEGGEKKSLFDPEDFRLIETAIRYNEYEWKVYTSYMSMYDGIVHALNHAEAKKQQIRHGKWRTQYMLAQVDRCEAIRKTKKMSPVIMTRKQYNRLERVATENNRENEFPLPHLFYHTLMYCMRNGGREGIPESVIYELETLKTVPCTNPRIIGTCGYNADRLDDVTLTKKVSSMMFASISMLKFRLEEMGMDLTDAEIGNVTKRMVELLLEDSYARKLTDREQQAVDALTKYHPDPLPERLDKYDALFYGMENYLEVYGDRYDYATQQVVEDVSAKEQFEEFQADYPSLYKALLAYAKRILPKTVTDDLNAVNDAVSTWGRMADKGIHPYVEWCEASPKDIISAHLQEVRDYNAKTKGWKLIEEDDTQAIAILEGTPQKVDAKGNYVGNVDDTLSPLDAEPTERMVRKWRENLLAEGFRHLYALCALADIIEDVYGVEGLGEIIRARLGMASLERECLDINSQMGMAMFMSTSLMSERREAYLKIFRPVHPDTYKPTQEAVEQVREEIAGLRAKRGVLSTTAYLMPYINRIKAGVEP